MERGRAELPASVSGSPLDIMVSVEEAVAVLSEGIAAETEQWWTHASSSHANAAQISGDFAKADIAVSESLELKE